MNELVKVINERRKILTKENNDYYDQLILYMRTKSLRSEQVVEETLLELLEHLIAGQEDGKSTEQIFGKNPRQLADDMLDNIPKESLQKQVPFLMQIGLLFFGVYVLFTGVGNYFLGKDISLPSKGIGNLVIEGVLLLLYLAVVLILILKLLNKSAFQMKKMVWSIFLLMVLLISGGSLLLALLNYALPQLGEPVTIKPITMIVIGILLLVISFLISKCKKV